MISLGWGSDAERSGEAPLRSWVCYQRGFVFVATMFFLLVLSVLAFGVLERGLLETKMFGFYQSKFKSFYKAEKKLLQIEGGSMEGLAPMPKGVCGVDFYRINVSAEYRGAKTCLESVFAKFNHDVCGSSSDNGIVEGRQSFLITDCHAQ